VSEWYLVEVAGRRRAIAAAHVRQVTQMGPVTPVPGAPPEVAGVTALGGQILPVLMLSPGGHPAAANLPLVIIEAGAATAGLCVERALGPGDPASAEPLDVVELLERLRSG
jgi:purine-binding chemotaxis protein CheW